MAKETANSWDDRRLAFQVQSRGWFNRLRMMVNVYRSLTTMYDTNTNETARDEREDSEEADARIRWSELIFEILIEIRFDDFFGVLFHDTYIIHWNYTYMFHSFQDSKMKAFSTFLFDPVCCVNALSDSFFFRLFLARPHDPIIRLSFLLDFGPNTSLFSISKLSTEGWCQDTEMRWGAPAL